MKKKFESLPLFDSLIEMYNRNYFLKYDFDKSVCLPCTYIMCDCNNLKGVNDQMGHEAGDRYIRTLSILRGCGIRSGSTVKIRLTDGAGL